MAPLSGDNWTWLLRDQLPDLDRVAEGCAKSRAWVVRRAMAYYLRAGEGRDILAVIEGREDIEKNGGHDMDDVLKEIEAIVRGEDQTG